MVSASKCASVCITLHLTYCTHCLPPMFELFTGQRYAGLSDLPHSRQQLLRRDVINPQNGHILCERNPRSTGLSAASSFLNESLKKASFLPIRMRKRRKLGSIYSTLHSLSLNADWPVTGPSSDSQNSFALGTPASLG